MASFTTSKNGYDKKEVDIYINNLNVQLDDNASKLANLESELAKLKEKDLMLKAKGDNISIALTAAVEKAKQIERSSQNVYKLKIQQLSILYARWEKLLNAMIEKYPAIEEVENVKNLLKEFKDSLKTTLKDDFKLNSITSPVQTDNDTIRLLLNKLNKYSEQNKNSKRETVEMPRKQLSKDLLNSQSELNRIEEKAPIIRPIYAEKHNQDENLLDKFLTDTSVEDSAYANIITSNTHKSLDINETGFDLKQAVNPKDDLNEIMKAFDFFNN